MASRLFCPGLLHGRDGWVKLQEARDQSGFRSQDARCLLQTLNLVVLDPGLWFEAGRRVLQRLDLCAGESLSGWSQWLEIGRAHV